MRKKEQNPLAMTTWHRLSETRRMKFIARSHRDLGWNGIGYGAVQVAMSEPKTITFNEMGRWRPNTGKALKFTNIFRWSFQVAGYSIRLEHLRFGPNHPVYLFDLVPAEADSWRSLVPHRCQDDSYTAVMHIKPDHIELKWTITGPLKQEDIHYWYT